MPSIQSIQLGDFDLPVFAGVLTGDESVSFLLVPVFGTLMAAVLVGFKTCYHHVYSVIVVSSWAL